MCNASLNLQFYVWKSGPRKQSQMQKRLTQSKPET